RAWIKLSHGTDPVPLAWDDGEPWQLVTTVTDADADEDGDGLTLAAQLVQRQSRIPLGPQMLPIGNDLIVVGRRLARFERGPTSALLPELLRGGPLTVNAADTSYLAFLLTRAGVDTDTLPEALQGADVQTLPVPCLDLEPTRDPETLAGHLLFDYAGTN